jgi:hypothetical protein
MVRLAISVEGETEELFVKELLVPYFIFKGIYIVPVNMKGNISVNRVCDEIKKLAYNFDCVTTFYDFYGFKRKNKSDTKHSLEQKIQKKMPESLRNKVIPYIQMHEFEALLFSSPQAIAKIFHKPELIDWVENVLHQFKGNPEAINDSVATAPSKRLLAKAPYRKTRHGPDIAKNIGIEQLKQSCSGFAAWITRLENLKKV